MPLFQKYVAGLARSCSARSRGPASRRTRATGNAATLGHRSHARDVAVAGLRRGRHDAEGHEIARAAATRAGAATASLKALDVADHVVGRQHQQHRIVVPAGALRGGRHRDRERQRGDRHGGRGIASDRFEQIACAGDPNPRNCSATRKRCSRCTPPPARRRRRPRPGAPRSPAAWSVRRPAAAAAWGTARATAATGGCRSRRRG